MATTKLWTVEEVERMPDDAFRYALIRGVLYRMPPPKARHGRIVSAINWRLYGFVAQHGLGAVYDQSGFVFERRPDTILGPDLAFVPAAHVPVDENAYPELAPTSLSKSCCLRKPDRQSKKRSRSTWRPGCALFG